MYIYTTHRIGQQMELINRIAKVSGQNDANRNAMRDEHIIARIVGIEWAPERIQKGRDAVVDLDRIDRRSENDNKYQWIMECEMNL